MKQIFLFPLGKTIDGQEQEQIRQFFKQFARHWTDHGEPVHMEIEFPYNALLLIRAWKGSGGRIDGCAQDDLFRFLRELATHFKLPLLRFDLIPIVKDQSIKFYTLYELKEQLQKGELSPQTPVILFSVRKEEEWERMPTPLNQTPLYRQLTQ
ncbi:MAG: hypothetical protein GXO48_07245 [Chlorobi bacterium]|nr:hypothetical protein [Chlorobiota bacterium]